MAHYNRFLKGNSCMFNSQQHSRANRELLNANRSRARKDMFFNGRNISPTPQKNLDLQLSENSTPHTVKKHNSHKTLWPSKAEGGLLKSENAENRNKENTTGVGVQPLSKDASPVLYTSRIAQVFCSNTKAEKRSKQEAFLMRFIEWKEKKKQEVAKKQQNMQKQRPFLLGGGSGCIGKVLKNKDINIAIGSFPPKEYQFKPPEGLEVPALANVVAADVKTKRRSLYTVVPTPPKKHSMDRDKKQIAERKVFRQLKPTTGLNSHASANSKPELPKKFLNKENASKKKISLNDPSLQQKAQTRQVSAVCKEKSTAPVHSQSKTAAHPITAVTETTKAVSAKFIKPRPLVLPPPEGMSTTTKKTTGIVGTVKRDDGLCTKISTNGTTRGGAVGKAKILRNKLKTEHHVQAQKPKQTKLSVKLKAKRPNSTTAALKRVPEHFKDNRGKVLLNELQKDLIVAETPTDLVFNNPFQPFLTSTHLKPSIAVASNDTTNLVNIGDTISPVEALGTEDVHPLEETDLRRSSAKRVLLLTQQDCVNKKESAKVDKKSKKFNFVIYGDDDDNIDSEEAPSNRPERKILDKQKESITTADVSPVHIENPENTSFLSQTPVKTASCEERPANYMSPFVSVTRGKVSARKEKEKRNSIYLHSAEDQNTEHTPQLTVEQRRTLEAARYFHKQLNDEIARLHQLCEEWEAYKMDNMPILEKSGGDDMINVTIGQTKLLTTKKFMQFKGLIERCEAGVSGAVAVDDACEDTRLIHAIDLEGFWSMLRLQTDDLDKRFANIARWRANNWQDPDEVKPKPKKNLQKVKKAKEKITSSKAKPSTALQEMLRQIHADMRKKKTTTQAEQEHNADTNNNARDITPNNPKGRRSSSRTPTSQHRRSIIVRDRKYHSAAPTVLNISGSPRARRSSVDSPKLTPHLKEMHNSIKSLQTICDRNDLLKTALIGSAKKRLQKYTTPPSSPIRSTVSPPPLNARKSILKTPGTAKGKLKNVVFDEELRIRKFKFTVDGDDIDDCDKDEMERVTKEDFSEEIIDGTDKRSYRLRTRKIVLRPSCEIKIPK